MVHFFRSDLVYLRSITSRMLEKSSGPSTLLIMNFRYKDFFGLPSSNTTMLATVSVPCRLEISKHSIFFGRFVSLKSLWSAATEYGSYLIFHFLNLNFFQLQYCIFFAHFNKDLRFASFGGL